MSNGSLDQWLQRLESLHPNEIELGLDRVSAVAERLGLLAPVQPVVTVAGTNGKGSTVAVLEALLVECGVRVGCYTSPHLLRFNERIRVAGQEVPDGDIIAAFEQVEAARGGVGLTYFEFATLAALLVFRARACEVLVLEVGLGGRLDAVNILDPGVAVITSIDLDHQAWLGERRGDIAREKAGVARAGCPVIVAEPDPPPELLERLDAIGAAPVLRLGREFQVGEAREGMWSAILRETGGTQRALGSIGTGALLPANIAAALQTALVLGVPFSNEQACAAVLRAAPTGRRQRHKSAGRDYILDVAHNPAAVEKLHEYLSLTNCYGKKIAIFSAMADKDLQGMIERVSDYFDAWYLADQPANTRAVKAQRVAELLRSGGQRMISISKSLRQAYCRAQSTMREGDQLVVFGSFHTVAAVLPLLGGDGGE